MSQKIKLGIFCGGPSAEHEVSLHSARNIFEAVDKNKYEVSLIGIEKDGSWVLADGPNFFVNPLDPKKISIKKGCRRITIAPQPNANEVRDLVTGEALFKLDVVFPVLHGTMGEDGSIQGFLRMAKIPFVGANVLGSAVAMDKDVMKRLLRDAQIPIGRFLTYSRFERKNIRFEDAKKELGLPMFVKPANTGSSVGIRKVKSAADFDAAIDFAFQFDIKILIEEAIVGREIECSALGNESVRISKPGEVIPQAEFYSYEAKYVDDNGAILKIPVELPDATRKKMDAIAIQTFKVLCCEGFARVDFFLKENGDLLINEINTLPGFTKISMYPKMWDVSGLKYAPLIDELIALAMARFKTEQSIQTSIF